MTLSSPEKKTPLPIYFIIILLPFLLLYWMLPFVSNLGIGNDYKLYSIQWQMELLFSIKTGSFPLYVPGFAFGHSSSTMTVGQIYHPITYISSNLPGYWSGKALQWNTFLRLLSLGLAHLALFAFLKKIRLNTLFSFLLSCITVYNLRMLDMFRYGASLETYTGFLFLCTAIGWYFIKPSKLLGPLSIIGATYWLICSGHPTMMYYGVLGVGLFFFVIPLFLTEIIDKKFQFKDVLIFWTKTGFYIFLGVLLSSDYIVPYYYDFVQQNSLRVSTDYFYSLGLEYIYGNISNFFMPLFSDIHNTFGGSNLFLMAAILPILRCFRVRIPYSVWIVWGVTLLVYLYTEGDRTPIHRWVWEYVPFASSVRPEGRLAIVMPILIMLLLSWIVQANPFSFRLKSLTVTLNPYVLLAFISILLLVSFSILSALIKPELSIFTGKGINTVPLSTIITITLVGMTSLIMMILYGTLPRARHVLGILLCFVILFHIGWILQNGTFIEEREDQPSFDQMKHQRKETINSTSYPGEGLFSSAVINQMDHSFMEPFLGKIYTHAIPVSSQDEAYDRMTRNLLPHHIFIENYNPENALLITDKALNMSKGTVNLIYSSFNRLQFRVTSEMPAFFGLSYPYTGYWNAWLNGDQTSIYRANGASHAVEIPKGESLIEFRYSSPAAFWGIVISSLTFILIGLYVCFISLNGFPRIIAAVFVLSIGIGFVILWNHSLYTGDNLGTQYTWTYTPPKTKTNLAYGKPTSHFPLHQGLYYMWYLKGGQYINHSNKVVDGNKSKGSGYKLRHKAKQTVILDINRKVIRLNDADFKLPDDTPSVIIDLNNEEQIDSLNIYASEWGTSETNCNFKLLLSVDQKNWKHLTSVTPELKHNDPIRIEFDSLQTARYIQIQMSRSCKVFIDEVEAY